MNGLRSALVEIETLRAAHAQAKCEILICPPATLIGAAKISAGEAIAIGAQDCHAEHAGAHTGDISAQMLKDAGADYVILGHSERRSDHAESDAQVHAKIEAAWANDLIAILCLGESLAERDAGQTLEIIARQLAQSLPQGANGANCVIAYEPIWAIGTGRIPELAQITEVHAFLRAELAARFGTEIAQTIRLLYGGSVKPNNAQDIFALENVDGALVGGASLKADDFGAIISALSQS